MDENLAGELLGPGTRAFQPGKQPHLELGLDAGDLVLAEAALGGLEELVADHGEQLVRAVGTAGGVDGEHAAVGKPAGEGVDGVAEPAPLAHLLEQARGHAAAKRAGADLRGEIIGVAVGRRLEGEHEMGLLERLLRARDTAAHRGAGSGSGAVPESNAPSRRSASASSARVVDGAGRREHHVAARDSGWRDRRRDGSRLKPLDALRRAEDRPADRLVGKGRLLHEVEDDVLGRIHGGGDLLQDHVALAGKLGAIEARRQDDVAQDVEREAASPCAARARNRRSSRRRSRR